MRSFVLGLFLAVTVLVSQPSAEESVTIVGGITVPINRAEVQGFGLVQGWVCGMHQVSVGVYGIGHPVRAVRKLEFGDNEGRCDDDVPYTQFAAFFNFESMPPGVHLIQAWVGNVQIGAVEVTRPVQKPDHDNRSGEWEWT